MSHLNRVLGGLVLAAMAGCAAERPKFGSAVADVGTPSAGGAADGASTWHAPDASVIPTASVGTGLGSVGLPDPPRDSGPPDSGEEKCDGEGTCVVPNAAALGDTCESDEQCGSHFCATQESGDKICCDTRCSGVCTTCGDQGHCDATPAADVACGALACDDSSACVTYPPAVSVAACVSFGECATAETYCVPDFTSAGDDCGDGKVCDGNGACEMDCPNTSGPDRVCTSDCPCDVAQGVCISDSECVTGLVCTSDAMAKLGFPSSSCLPEHCVNDRKDAAETSVDCEDGCGCRATYEVVQITGVPADAGFAGLSAMSGDGSAFAGIIARDTGARFSSPFPARIDAHGVVTELPGYGMAGNAYGISADGSVLVGDLYCDDPPSCATEALRPFRWIDGQDPTAVYYSGSGTVVSNSGTWVAGTRQDANSGTSVVFRASNNLFLDIPELDSVTAMSVDGEFVAGRLSELAGRSAQFDEGALWSATQRDLIPLAAPVEWTSWHIDVLSDDGSVFAGSAYTGSSTLAFIWRDGTFSEFPKLSGADNSSLKGISSDGSVIAGYSETRAFIWDQTMGIRTVLAETVARGLELSVDLELPSVDYLSDDGRILVGWIYGSDTPSFWRVMLLP